MTIKMGIETRLERGGGGVEERESLSVFEQGTR
jgi:hypothetical protein